MQLCRRAVLRAGKSTPAACGGIGKATELHNESVLGDACRFGRRMPAGARDIPARDIARPNPREGSTAELQRIPSTDSRRKRTATTAVERLAPSQPTRVVVELGQE